MVDRSRRGLKWRAWALLIATIATVVGAFGFATSGLSGEDTGGWNFLFWAGAVATIALALSLLYGRGRAREKD